MHKPKLKNCLNFKPVNELFPVHKQDTSSCCKNCVYFSSRNCHKDIADSIETELDIFWFKLLIYNLVFDESLNL